MDRSAIRPGQLFDSPLTIGRTIRTFDPVAYSLAYSRSSRVRRHAAAMLVVALLIVLAFRLFPLQNVTLVAGDETLRVRAAFGDRQALEAAALELGPGDRLQVARAGDQAAVAVQRATPVVVLADGAGIAVRTRARTIAGVLALANVAVREGDRVYVDGIAAAPGDQLDRFAAASAAATASQPLRIELVRALPASDASPDAASSPPPSAEAEAASGGGALTALRDPAAGPPLVYHLPPYREAYALAVAAIPERFGLTVDVGGQVETLRLAAETVADVLDHLGVALGEHDRLSHALDEPLTEGMAIAVVRVEKVIEEYIEYIEPRVYRRDDHTLAPGEERVVEGTLGEVRVWETVTYENGAEVAREPHSAVRESEPVSGEILRGPVAAAGGPVVVDDYEGPYREKVRVWATWYNATHGGKEPDHPAYGITYSGIPLEYGICAVDPDYIPLGTRFYVPGYGECLAADTGGLINGYDVDLGFPEGHAPRPWHTGYVHIYILD